MQRGGFALQHVWKDAVIPDGQKKQKDYEKTFKKPKPLFSTGQKNMTGFQLWADLL